MQESIDENENIVKRASETTHFMLGLLNECDVHLLKPDALDKSMVLKCIHLKYDTDKINLDYAHINREGDLINSRSDAWSELRGRLTNYQGVCSTISLPHSRYVDYWETKIKVTLNKNSHRTTTSWRLVSLLMTCGTWIITKPVVLRAYSLIVAHSRYREGIYREIKVGDDDAIHLSNAMPNETGTHDLHYGVAYDDARKKIVFIDVKENEAMGTFDRVDTSQPLWPMFGVLSTPLSTHSVIMRLVEDIKMTTEKKATIVKALRLA
ncbi:uncharacterized protein LOC124268114 isoform X2 [Haliotis rubra]|uniref:uncharacterized protein LOC124268114 isoform X2 n=1 Tax=Haliotis rubra TaxID=36100 RepID=UPI001EE5C77F|nr:uncharacterized protein LOC124268114 isoform X2 [Haliotis rubra]